MLDGWRYWWRRYLHFMPWQPCYICGRLFFACIPWYSFREWRWDNRPDWYDYCSKECCDEDLDMWS